VNRPCWPRIHVLLSDLLAVSSALSGVRSAAWAFKGAWSVVRLLRPAEPPIFGGWRFYDDEPAGGNAVGVAELKRVGPFRKVHMIGVRHKSQAGAGTPSMSTAIRAISETESWS
jgi:hypothetical protein